MMRQCGVWAIGLGLCLGFTAQAAVISDAQDVPSPVIAAPRPTPILDAGDLVTPGLAYYLDVLDFVAAQPADILLTADPSGWTPEYVTDQTIFNLTGQSWVGFRVELGFGTGESFVASTPSDGLEFTLADLGLYFMSSWDLIQTDLDVLLWGNEELMDGEGDNLQFAFSVPDFGDSSFSFTLRQTPILVPEPASFGVLLLGVSLAFVRATRRH